MALATAVSLTACFNPDAQGETSASETTATTEPASSSSSAATSETPTSSGVDTSITGDGTTGTSEAMETGGTTSAATGPGIDEPFCGDGLVDPDLNEVCDDGNFFNDDGCTNFCELPACGDGFVAPGEACDDGNAASQDGCSNACQCERSNCGDGVTGLDEECDDGNRLDGDACSACCERRYFNVFVSSKRFTGGTIGSPQAGDIACTELATGAGLPGSYQAWLSGDRGVATPANAIFPQPYGLPGTGEIVAHSLQELRSGQLAAAIHVTETGGELGTLPDDPCADPDLRVWTGTEVNGGGAWNATCGGWWSVSGAGRFGAAGTAGATWASCEMEAKCDTMARLYCFEVQT